LENDPMKQVVPSVTLVDAPEKESGAIGSMPCSGAVADHLRVREATAKEKEEFASLFPERDCARWVEQAFQANRSWAPVVERFENRKWIPIGLAIVSATGQMAFGLLPSYRGQGLSSAAIRAVIQYLREYTLTVLTVRLDDTEPLMARAFERAGFVFAGPIVSADRTERRYDFVIRGDCTTFNVWI